MPSDNSKKIPTIKMSLKDALKAVKDKKIVVTPGPLPHTLPSYKEPNYNHFCTLPYWYLDESVLLLNGINPEYYENYPLGRWKKFDYFSPEVQRTYKVLERAHLDKDEDLGAKTDSTGRATMKPIKLFEFAKKKRLPIPDQLIKEFDGLINPITEDTPPYLNPKHEYYAPELHIAVQAWLGLFGKGKIKAKKGNRDQAKKWLEKNYRDLSNNAVDRIITVIMPYYRKRGGTIPSELSDSEEKPTP